LDLEAYGRKVSLHMVGA